MPIRCGVDLIQALDGLTARPFRGSTFLDNLGAITMLKKFSLTALIAAAHILSFPVFGQVTGRQSNDTSSVEKDVRALANQLTNAIVERDITALERLLIDDYVDVNPDGAVSSRAQFIDEYKNPPTTANKFESAEFGAGDSQIRFYGDVAILTGPSIWRGRTAGGQAFTGTLVTSMVAVRKKGQWQIATTHSSSAPPQAKANASR